MDTLCVDLFCGLGGWAEGFLAGGYSVIGFDVERHDYGTGSYPGQLVLQDVLTLDGRQFKDAAVIVASPPCQFFSYTAMPWSRAKKLAGEVRNDPARLEKELALFRACFRIAREAGVPLVVENVCGAQAWVGPAKWHYGSFYLWGDVPALMPIAGMRLAFGRSFQSEFVKNTGGSWFKVAHNTTSGVANNPVSVRGGYRQISGSTSSKSNSRKAISAQIAKIPFKLARHIARCFKHADSTSLPTRYH